jgi:hypothetical protein
MRSIIWMRAGPVKLAAIFFFGKFRKAFREDRRLPRDHTQAGRVLTLLTAPAMGIPTVEYALGLRP